MRARSEALRAQETSRHRGLFSERRVLRRGTRNKQQTDLLRGRGSRCVVCCSKNSSSIGRLPECRVGWLSLRVLEVDEKRGGLKILLEVPEDFYFLALLLERNDVVYAWTTRQLRIDSEGRRGDRVRVYIGLQVEKISYSKFLHKIRITGRIVDAPEDVGGKGSYHTLSLGLGDTVRIVKQRGISALTREILSKASSAIKRVLLVSVGDDEVAVGYLSPVGVEVKFVSSIEYRKTGEEGSIREQVYTPLRKKLEEVLKSGYAEDVDEVVVATTERLAGLVSETLSDIGARAKLVKVSEGGEAGIHELLRREDLKSLFTEVRTVVERELVDEVLQSISRSSGKVVLGLESVAKVAKWGVVEKLLVTDDLLFDEATRETVFELLNDVLSLSGKVYIIPSESEWGETLRRLGGAAALLFYELKDFEKTAM
uniref:Protein pelota homolog n=1 Tax=Thermofilum pendens TaxID=2269 RepID=A0A7J3X9K5_THEPE